VIKLEFLGFKKVGVSTLWNVEIKTQENSDVIKSKKQEGK